MLSCDTLLTRAVNSRKNRFRVRTLYFKSLERTLIKYLPFFSNLSGRDIQILLFWAALNQLTCWSKTKWEECQSQRNKLDFVRVTTRLLQRVATPQKLARAIHSQRAKFERKGIGFLFNDFSYIFFSQPTLRQTNATDVVPILKYLNTDYNKNYTIQSTMLHLNIKTTLISYCTIKNVL